MGVIDYTQVEKKEVKELIEEFDKFESIFLVAPLEHYSIQDLIDLCKSAREKNLVMSIEFESSNFYYGSLVQFSRKRG